MRFLSYSVEYKANGRTHGFKRACGESFANAELEVAAEFEDGLLKLSARAKAPLRILHCRVQLAHDFRADERVLLNGYQSWTETRELSPSARMRGLLGTPRALVNRYVLDASGDYRFFPYDGKPGHLHGWTYAHVRRGSRYELLASTDESHGFTLIDMRTQEGSVLLETESPARELAAGEEVPVSSCVLLRGSREEVYDRWFALSGLAARPAPPLIGYSSWYRHYGDIDEGKLLHDLAGTVSALSGLGLAGCRDIFQIDDGWTKVGDWLEPDARKFPRGMAALAREIQDSALVISNFLPIFCGCVSDFRELKSSRPGVLPPYYSEWGPKKASNHLHNRKKSAKNSKSPALETSASGKTPRETGNLSEICGLGCDFEGPESTPPAVLPSRYSQKAKNGTAKLPQTEKTGQISAFPWRFSAGGRENHLVAGLWLAPFVCERDSRLFHEHPDWLLKDATGKPVQTGSHWSGGYALDTLNPEVRGYVRKVLQTVTRSWGFRFLKLDFLYAACMLPHGGLNRGELMADAIDLLRSAVGEDVLLDGCGVPLASAFGKLDYCRVGCDVGLDWNGAAPMRLLERERVSTKNSLACTKARAPLDGRAFGCDPDVFFLRDDVKLKPAQRQQLLEADAACGSMLLTSDDMASWDESARERFRHAARSLLSKHEERP